MTTPIYDALMALERAYRNADPCETHMAFAMARAALGERWSAYHVALGEQLRFKAAWRAVWDAWRIVEDGSRQPAAGSQRKKFKTAFASLVVAFCLLSFALPARAQSRTYWPVAIAQMPTTRHTHVKVEGWVTLVKHEGDGDVHIRLCESSAQRGMDAKHCIVAEIIPDSEPRNLPCTHEIDPCNQFVTTGEPKVGTKIRVEGISRYDREHRWQEVHPVESWEVDE